MASHSIKKWASGLALVGLFMFSGVVLFQLQTAFGWTNPLVNPPGGSGLVTASSTKIGINTTNPSTTLTVNGGLSVSGNQIFDVATPIGPADGVNKAYVDAQSGSGGGGGSLILYYREVTNGSGTTAPPACPAGWTEQYASPGYGPHYLGILNYGWLTSSGGDGGFGGTGAPSSPPPASGSSYTLNSIAIGSDSVCSSDQKTIVPFSSFYQNSIQTSFASHDADACYTDTSVTPNVTTCNRCVVCQK
jgi:hypothetical protein